ncbi:MAG: DivIVA domain-containing protein [Bacteroidetes bacterium]|nr:DivIVA domain-containing protein [Bacteroidota bacterium]
MNVESIAGREFKTVRKGLHADEVRAYLRLLAEDLVAMAEENGALRQEILALEAQLEQSRELDQKVRGMLAQMNAASRKMVGQAEASAAAMSYKVEKERTAIVEQAKNEASVIIRDAERRAERQMMKANARLEAMQQQIDLLETKKLALITRIKSILRAQVDFLAALEKNPKHSPLRSALHNATKTREGLDADSVDEILQRLNEREFDHD